MNLKRLAEAIDNIAVKHAAQKRVDDLILRSQKFPLKEIRTALGMTQKDVANFLGCAQQTVSCYERGVTDIPYKYAARLVSCFVFSRSTPE